MSNFCDFKNLSFKEKYEKVLAMLEILKEGDSMFSDFYELLITLKEDTSEELLTNIYSMIMLAIEQLEKEENNKELEKMELLKIKLKRIKEIEEKKKQEEDPDKLLENI